MTLKSCNCRAHCVWFDCSVSVENVRALVMTVTQENGMVNNHFSKVTPKSSAQIPLNFYPTHTRKTSIHKIQSNWDDIISLFFWIQFKLILDLTRSFCIIFLLVSCLFTRIIIRLTLTRSAINQYDFLSSASTFIVCDWLSAYRYTEHRIYWMLFTHSSFSMILIISDRDSSSLFEEMLWWRTKKRSNTLKPKSKLNKYFPFATELERI